jgi:hypothetical protein
MKLSSKSRRPSQTAPEIAPPSDYVTVTLPTHPLQGLRLPVARAVRAADGRRYVDVEHPQGLLVRLALEWTDRGGPLVPPHVQDREVRLAVRGLLELVRAVAAALDQHRAGPQGNAQVPCDARSNPLDAVTPERPTEQDALARAADAGAARDAQRLGHARAQNASRRSRSRGARS